MTTVVDSRRGAAPEPAPADPEADERFAGGICGAALGAVEIVDVVLAGQPSAGTGAVVRLAVVRRYAGAAGFASVRELPVEDPQFRLYRLDCRAAPSEAHAADRSVHERPAAAPTGTPARGDTDDQHRH